MEKEIIGTKTFRYSLLDYNNVVLIGISLEMFKRIEEKLTDVTLVEESGLFLNLLENAMLESANILDHQLLVRLGEDMSTRAKDLEAYIQKAMEIRIADDILRERPEWIRVPVKISPEDLTKLIDFLINSSDDVEGDLRKELDLLLVALYDASSKMIETMEEEGNGSEEG